MELDSIRLFIVLSVFLMLLWANLRRKKIEYFIILICLMFLVKDFYICLFDTDLFLWKIVMYDILLDTYITLISEGFLALRLFKYCLSKFCRVNFYIVCLIFGLCIYMCTRLKKILDMLYLNEIVRVSEELTKNFKVVRIIIFLSLVSFILEIITRIQWSLKNKNLVNQGGLTKNSSNNSKCINKKDKCRRE